MTDRLAVIIGGGAVALRKARGLIDAGATRIRMVSPDFHGDVPEIVEKVCERFQPLHLDGAGLVFAATDSAEVNDAVVTEARRRGILVNRADSDLDLPGDFTTPAILRQGPVVISVSTSGTPALATMIRDEISLHSNPIWPMMATAMQTLRPIILSSPSLTGEERRDAFRSLATPEAVAAMASGGIESLWRRLVMQFPQLSGETLPFHGLQK